MVALDNPKLVAVAAQVSLDLWANEQLISTAQLMVARRFARTFLHLDLCCFQLPLADSVGTLVDRSALVATFGGQISTLVP